MGAIGEAGTSVPKREQTATKRAAEDTRGNCINIAICEDNEQQSELMVEFIRNWVEKRRAQGLSYNPHENHESSRNATVVMPTIHQYADFNSFSFFLDEHGPFDLFFIDIDLSGSQAPAKKTASLEVAIDNAQAAAVAPTAPLANEDGIRIATRVRERDPDAIIVFVTSNISHVLKGYKVQAFDFLPKPVHYLEIERILDYANKRVRRTTNQTFIVNTSLGIKRVDLADVYYFKAQRQFVELHAVQGTETFRARFADVIQKLSPCEFVSPHRSYLVNIAHIRRLSTSSITMSDGSVIPIARTCQQDIHGLWLDYLGNTGITIGLSELK